MSIDRRVRAWRPHYSYDVGRHCSPEKGHHYVAVNAELWRALV